MVSKRVRMVGHNVSHANNKTKRLFRLNVQPFLFTSEVLGKPVRLNLSVKGMRLVEKAGGIDSFLKKAKKSQLDKNLHALKKTFDKRCIAQQAAA